MEIFESLFRFESVSQSEKSHRCHAERAARSISFSVPYKTEISAQASE